MKRESNKVRVRDFNGKVVAEVPRSMNSFDVEHVAGFSCSVNKQQDGKWDWVQSNTPIHKCDDKCGKKLEWRV